MLSRAKNETIVTKLVTQTPHYVSKY